MPSATLQVHEDIEALALRECSVCPPEYVSRCAHFGEACVIVHKWTKAYYVCFLEGNVELMLGRSA